MGCIGSPPWYLHRVGEAPMVPRGAITPRLRGSNRI